VKCLHPREVVETIDQVLPANTRFYLDIGAVTSWVVHFGRRDLPGTFFTDTVAGAMDYAIPAAIGGKLAAPDVSVCAVVGDGGALMGSILEVFSAVEHEVPLAVVVFNDGGWGMLEHGIVSSPLRASPRPSFRFRCRANFARLARALNADGLRAATLPELRKGLERCILPRRAIVLDVIVDPRAAPPIGGRTAHVNRHMHAEIGTDDAR
jgi:acetolactate synthase-1/2/3 large subunit